MKEGDNYYFYHNDHLGTAQKMTSINGAVAWSATYSSFGEATVDPSSTITNNLRFPSQYFDQETGLHYNYHRFYDSEHGRYLKVDKDGIGMGLYQLYDYAKANPLIYQDPLGLMAICTYLASIPVDLSIKTETKWNKPCEWFLENTITRGGQYPVFWLTAECVCTRKKFGTKTTTLILKWTNFFLCYDDFFCKTWIQTTYSFDEWKRTKTVWDVKKQGINAGWFLNEASAEMACKIKCQNLNYQ